LIWVIKLKTQMDAKANSKPDDYKRRRTDSFDTADPGSGSGARRRGDEPAFNSYGYRATPQGGAVRQDQTAAEAETIGVPPVAPT
jgi:hypothetical protein